MIRNYSYLNLGLTLNFNGKSYVSKNGLLDLAERQHDRGPALPAHPPHGGGHRSGDHPRHGLRRELRLVRQRPAHHAGRHASDGPARRRSPRRSRSSTTRTTTRRTSARRSSRPFRSRSPTRSSRSQTKTKLRFEGDRTGGLGAQLRRRFSDQAPRRLPAQALRDGADSPAEDSSRTRRSARRSPASRRRPARRPRR